MCNSASRGVFYSTFVPCGILEDGTITQQAAKRDDSNLQGIQFILFYFSNEVLHLVYLKVYILNLVDVYMFLVIFHACRNLAKYIFII